MSRPARSLVALVVTVVLGAAALGATLVLLVPATKQLTNGTAAYGDFSAEFSTAPRRSFVYDRDGNRIAVLFAEEDREPIPLREVPDSLIEAVLSIEDRNFYDHDGVDLKGTLRALSRNVSDGGLVEGGSTLTQQLVKIGLIQNRERTLDRKLKEAVLALRLEQEMSKDEILERYLNLVNFGGGAYGVRSASERYFDKEPEDLNVGESALLAGLIRSPEGNNPVNYPDRARDRRTQVLEAMRDEGYITEDEVTFFDAGPLPTKVHAFSATRPRPNTFYVEEVKRRLLRDERLGDTYQERYDAVFRGGLHIHTGFDPRMQLLAEAAVRETIPPGQFTGALVSIDNGTGEVRAMFGGASFDADQFNLATQSIRQTGSSFKSITLATALDMGYSIEDIVSASSPCQFEIPGSEPWVITASGGGNMTLRDATVESINCAYARLALAVGPENIVAMAQRLGIDTSEMQAVPSITLGTQGTPMLDMAAAYSVFANDGIRRDPVFVTRVEGPDGKLLFSNLSASGQQVLDPEVARTLVDTLKGVVTSGTGTRARLEGGREAFGKTGTTDNLVDALFVGGTKHLTTAVWMGNPKALEPMTSVGAVGQVFGGTYPAMVWKAFMDPAHEGLEPVAFTPPDETAWPRAGRVDEETGRDAADSPGSGPIYAPSGPPPTVVRVPLTTAPPATPPTVVLPPGIGGGDDDDGDGDGGGNDNGNGNGRGGEGGGGRGSPTTTACVLVFCG